MGTATGPGLLGAPALPVMWAWVLGMLLSSAVWDGAPHQGVECGPAEFAGMMLLMPAPTAAATAAAAAAAAVAAVGKAAAVGARPGCMVDGVDPLAGLAPLAPLAGGGGGWGHCQKLAALRDIAGDACVLTLAGLGPPWFAAVAQGAGERRVAAG